MATWGELDHIFDINMPSLPAENPKFHETISLPWKHIESMKSVDQIFAQLYLKENLDHQESSISSPSPFTLSPSSSLSSDIEEEEKKVHRRSNSASSFNSERSSSICNEESSDDADKWSNNGCPKRYRRNNSLNKNNYNCGGFPPPISCIGRSGKPWVSFQSIRKNGRFILTEVRIPTQEFMHACRENGRLKLHFIHSESEEEEEEEEEDEEMGEKDDYDGDGEATTEEA